MHVIFADNGSEAMCSVVDRIFAHGKFVSPRGLKTLELSPATVVIDNPRDVLPVAINRRGLSPAIGVAEALQAIAGISIPALMERISPAFGRFTNQAGQFDGAYGPRLAGALQHVAERLVADPDSRQAVAPIWWPHDSGRQSSRDYPCTLSLHFLVREDRLNLHVVMRSNDAWLGFPYDIFQFAQVQLTMANLLSLRPGTYTHTANSLHLYQSNFEDAAALNYEGIAEPLLTDGVGRRGDNWRHIQLRAEAILLGYCLAHMTPSEATYDKILDSFTYGYTDDVYRNVYDASLKEEAA